MSNECDDDVQVHLRGSHTADRDHPKCQIRLDEEGMTYLFLVCRELPPIIRELTFIRLGVRPLPIFEAQGPRDTW